MPKGYGYKTTGAVRKPKKKTMGKNPKKTKKATQRRS